MMENFKLSGLDQISIWRNESPIEAFKSKIFYEDCVQATQIEGLKADLDFVMELKQPRGPRCLYGLLGVKIRFANERILKIKVGDGQAETRLYVGSMLDKIEIPYYGFPEGVAESVLYTLQKEMRESQPMFAGSMEVCFGAHGQISSNPYVFKLLSRALPKVLFMESLSSDLLTELFLSLR
ncbi:hypothetical protein ACO0LC_28970 [Undibacterium sp. JH2W]|uniref:hypothetical protein n=1 Tax=Undibacterium sp. JH2W TaxID=3413037 RepID=UPI003BF1F832